MMEPTLARRFPGFRTYRGRSLDGSGLRVRLDLTAHGLRATVEGGGGGAVLRPYRRGEREYYVSFREGDFPRDDKPFSCGTTGDAKTSIEAPAGPDAGTSDCQLRTYRLAVAITGAYATRTLGASAAGTAADEQILLSHLVSSVNQVNGWYERDASVRMVLVDATTSAFYYDEFADPYDDDSSGGLIDENTANLDAVIGAGDYDVGHVFGASGGGTGGVARLRSVCTPLKGEGATYSSAFGILQPRFLKVFAHELGHQFGAGHTQGGNCQRMPDSAMEPGSGSTIMSYVTSACDDQVQARPDYYFHAVSIAEMTAHVLATSCAAAAPQANRAPRVSAGVDRVVPAGTPLRLLATGVDDDGDALTYTWEQYDNEAADFIPPRPQNSRGPSFRSLPPSPSPARYLPNLPAVLAGQTPTFEVLPTATRTMTFRVTARDNSADQIGCTAWDELSVQTVSGAAFAVQSPSGAAVRWAVGTDQTVTWDVAGTNAAPVSCANVDILLSRDGGLTYPETLAQGVPNDGTATVSVPDAVTSEARVLVQCSDNIFFNVSPADFTVERVDPTFALGSDRSEAAVCAGATVRFDVNVESVLGFSEDVVLQVAGAPPGITATLQDNRLAAGSATELSIAAASTVPVGAYAVRVTGVAGATTRALDLAVLVASPTAAVAALAPASGAQVDPDLTFTWTAPSTASGYELEVARAADFADAALRVGTTDPTYTAGTAPGEALDPNTAYFWRVRATTACGRTDWSAPLAFRTTACFRAIAQDQPAFISASGTPTVRSTLSVGLPGEVSRLTRVSLRGTHTWMSDLVFTLVAPDGQRQARLADRECDSSDDFDVSFSDDAAQSIASAPCAPFGGGGTYRPREPLSVFAGIPMAGEWTLVVDDQAGADGGALESWSLEFCGSSVNPLPLTWGGFDARAGDGAIALSWQTTGERDNAGFDVERRAGHESDFVAIGRVDPTSGSGDVTAVNAYGYIDRAVVAGVSYYYRIRQRDLDGASSVTPVRSASLAADAGAGLRVQPNPTSGRFSVLLGEGAGAGATLRLYNASGALLRTFETAAAARVDVDELPSGLYLLRVEYADGRSAARKVVVE